MLDSLPLTCLTETPETVFALELHNSFMAFVTWSCPASSVRRRLSQHCGVGMCEATPPQASRKPTQDMYVRANLGLKAQLDAIDFAQGDIGAVADMCAIGVLDAFRQTFAKDEYSRVFLACGGGFNGLVGAHLALPLKKLGYETTVYWVEQSATPPLERYFEKWREAAAAQHIQVCDFVPSTIAYFCDVAIDALLGMGFDGGDIRPVYWNIFSMMTTTELPILSIDMPSGWDLDNGPRNIDVRADSFIKPDVLVSLGVPKFGAKIFSGSYHFLGGRHLPPNWVECHDLKVPSYPGKGASCSLICSNPFPAKGFNGEIYGNSGQYMGTLFTANPRRKWISDEEIENDPDLWDELD